MTKFKSTLVALTKNFITLSEDHLEKLQSHYELMLAWNRRINLTRIVELDEAVRRHYGESLFLAAHLPNGPICIVDVGSGAGFPGHPVAVVRPECPVTLVESVRRKAVFLQEASRGLPNVSVATQRAEDLPAGGYDCLISRAVAWRELADLRLAPRMVLLAAGKDIVANTGDRSWDWERPIDVPWDSTKVLIRGSRGCST